MADFRPTPLRISPFPPRADVARVLWVLLLAGCGADDALDMRGSECEEVVSASPTIEASLGVTLSTEEGDVAGLGLLPRAARGEEGQFFVLDEFVVTGGGPLTFDPVGKFVGVLGVQGDGPDEFRQPTRIASAGGATLAVFDRLHGLKVLGSDGAELARHAGIPPPRAPEGFIMLSDTLLVVADPARRPLEAPEHGLLAYQLPSGRLLGGFGPMEALVPGAPSGITSVAPSGEDGVWAVTRPHVVERFRVEGGPAVDRVELPSDWLSQVEGLGRSQAADTGYVIHTVYEEDRRFGAVEGAVGLDGEDGGRRSAVLWVLSLPRDPAYPNPFAASAPGAPILSGELQVRSLIRHRKTVVTVICLASGEVLAHRTMEGLGLHFLPDGSLLTLHEGPGYDPEIRVHRLRLR